MICVGDIMSALGDHQCVGAHFQGTGDIIGESLMLWRKWHLFFNTL